MPALREFHVGQDETHSQQDDDDRCVALEEFADRRLRMAVGLHRFRWRIIGMVELAGLTIGKHRRR